MWLEWLYVSECYKLHFNNDITLAELILDDPTRRYWASPGRTYVHA
jgi:hypothetical protein